MKRIKALSLAILFLAFAAHCSAQREAKLLGRWVNIKDTAEHIILSANGEFKMVSYDFNDGVPRARTGMWMYKSLKKRLILFYGPELPKQLYKVRDVDGLGYTLNQAKRGVVFARSGVRLQNSSSR
jgi:hypothetical protein